MRSILPKFEAPTSKPASSPSSVKGVNQIMIPVTLKTPCKSCNKLIVASSLNDLKNHICGNGKFGETKEKESQKKTKKVTLTQMPQDGGASHSGAPTPPPASPARELLWRGEDPRGLLVAGLLLPLLQPASQLFGQHPDISCGTPWGISPL